MAKSILLQPASPDSPLLAAGVCGARPPMVWEAAAETEPPKRWYGKAPWASRPARWLMYGSWTGRGKRFNPAPVWALPLLWRDEVCVEGVNRAARTLAEREGLATPWGVLWMPAGGIMHSWALDAWDDERNYAPEWPASDERRWIDVPALRESGAAGAGALSTLALAIVCAARGIGRVVVIEEVSGG